MTERPIMASLPNAVRRTLTANGETLSYYLGRMESDVARALTFVPVGQNGVQSFLNEECLPWNAGGYQRPGSATRMRKFGKYLAKHPLSVIPAVVLSGRDQWEFEPSQQSSDFGTIHCYGAAAIVDGQHRVGGFTYLYDEDELDNRPIDFVLVVGLDLEAESALFEDINVNARGVPMAIRAILGGGDDVEVAQALHEDDDSPFQGRIKIGLPGSQYLFTMDTLGKCVGRTFRHGAFTDTVLDSKVELMKGYWTRIADTFPEEWADFDLPRRERKFKLLEATGLITFSLAGEDILADAFDPMSQTINWPQVEDTLQRLLGFLDLDKTGQFENLTGERGAPVIHRRIQEILAAPRGPDHAGDVAEE